MSGERSYYGGRPGGMQSTGRYSWGFGSLAQELTPNRFDLPGVPARLRLADQAGHQLGSLLAAQDHPVRAVERVRRDALALEVRRVLRACRDQAVAHDRAGADDAGELDVRGDLPIRPRRQR